MTEQQKEYRKMLQKRTSNIKANKTYYSITNNYITKWKPSEATIINLEAMNSIKYHSAALMVSNTFIRWYNISHLWSSQNPNVNTDIVIALIQLFKWWRHLHLYWKISRLWSEIVKSLTGWKSIIWHQNNSNAVTHFLGKVLVVLHHWFPHFLRMSRNEKTFH